MPAEDHAIHLPRQPRPTVAQDHPGDERRAQARMIGRERLRARRARIHRIRVRMVGIGVAVFVALWGVIFVQLVTGHDPVLAAQTKTAAASSGSANSSGSVSSSGGTSSGSSGGSSGSVSSSSGSSGSGLSALTTQQS